MVEKIWEEKFSFKDLLPLAPKTQIVSEKAYVEIEYKPIYWEDEGNSPYSIMVILKDKTRLIAQEKKIVQTK